VDIVRGEKRRRLHKAFLRYHDPNNWPLLRDALKAMGRADLIGNGKHHLIPTFQPVTDGSLPECTAQELKRGTAQVRARQRAPADPAHRPAAPSLGGHPSRQPGGWRQAQRALKAFISGLGAFLATFQRRKVIVSY
jgi:hypothetical protein